MLPFRVVYSLYTLGDGFIEPRHHIGFPFRYFFMKHIDHALHGNGHRVILDEGVIFKERLEYRLCDDVLSQHFNGVIRSHSRIQIFVQPGKKFVKGIPVFPTVGDQLFNSGNVLLRDCRDILCPQLPITPCSHFFNHAGKDHTLERLEFQIQFLLDFLRNDGIHIDVLFRSTSSAAFALSVPANKTMLLCSLRLPVFLNFIDFSIKPVVMRPQCVQDGPHDAKAVAFVKSLFRAHGFRDDNGDDNVAILFSGSFPHHAPDRLNDVNLGIPGG